MLERQKYLFMMDLLARVELNVIFRCVSIISLYYMQINKALTAKEKKIRKRQRAKQRRRNESMNKFSFQEQLIDLVSQPSMQEQNDAPQEIAAIQVPQINIPTQNQKEKDEANEKFVKISDEEYYLIVEVGKFYKAKKENQRIQTQITNINENEYFMINGSKVKSHSSSSTYIFSLKRQGNPIKFDKYLSALPLSIKEKITKTMLNTKTEAIIKSSSKISLEETSQPWANLPDCVTQNESIMLVGVKNTGKSTLAEFLLNTRPDDCVLLDCDVGRNSSLEGCVSLTSSLGSKKIWIGQLTPLNNLQTYIRAIRYLFQFYSKNWFTKQLVVNTMGYLTGLGEFLLYEIYQIVKPKTIIALQSNGQRYQLNNILTNIKSGNYVNKLYVSNGLEQKQTASTSNIFIYQNIHSINKRSVARFEKMFESDQSKVSNIVQLIQAIKKSSQIDNRNPHLISKKRNAIEIYEQSRHGKEEMEGQEVVSYRQLDCEESVDMRLIILGRMIQENETNLFSKPSYESSSSLFEVSGLGFGFQGRIYFKAESEGAIGIVNEGMDFEKGFYHLNEKQLIDLQLRYGRLNYIMVTTKGLGSKGVRNNPSKVSA